MHVLRRELPYRTYIWEGVLEPLNNYLKNLPDGSNVDIAYCRFDPSCVLCLESHSSRITFVNTEEELLNDILTHNREVRGMTQKVIRRDIIFDFYNEEGRQIQDFLLAVKNSDKSVVWTLNTGVLGTKFERNIVPVCLALVMNFPKRQFDILGAKVSGSLVQGMKSYFSFNDYLVSDTIQYLVGSSGLLTIELLSDDSIYYPGIGTMPKELWITKNVLPGWLGVESIRNDTHRLEIYEKVLGSIKFADQLHETSNLRTMRGVITRYGGV